MEELEPFQVCASVVAAVGRAVRHTYLAVQTQLLIFSEVCFAFSPIMFYIAICTSCDISFSSN